MSSDIAVRREIGLLTTVDEVVHDLDEVDALVLGEQVDELNESFDAGTLVLKNTIELGKGKKQEIRVGSRLLDNKAENPDDVLASLLVLQSYHSS